MQCTLNFSGEDRKDLLAFLKGFSEKETKSGFEAFRCVIEKSTVTLYKTGKLLIQGEDCEKVKEKILNAVEKDDEEILGIDETGRGEGFGPFVIAGVLAKPSAMRELRDSKKVKKIEEKRKLVEEKASGIAVLSVSSRELSLLHEKGISMNDIEVAAINAWAALLKESGEKAKVIVDGSPLKGCDKRVSFQVKGDDLNPVIGAASIVAKSVRDESRDKGNRKGWGTWSKKAVKNK